MDELLEEIEYEINLLVKSGFYNKEEILEIIEEQFIDENIEKYDLTTIIKKSINSLNLNELFYFTKLKNSFNNLTKIGIVSIHNGGFDFEEGVNDAMEIYTHLVNNNYNPKGFVFYSFTDIEYAISNNELYLSFGDYMQDKNLALSIGEDIIKTLNENNLKTSWNKNINEEILIKPFIWQKEYDNDIYEMEGAVKTFINLHKK